MRIFFTNEDHLKITFAVLYSHLIDEIPSQLVMYNQFPYKGSLCTPFSEWRQKIFHNDRFTVIAYICSDMIFTKKEFNPYHLSNESW